MNDRLLSAIDTVYDCVGDDYDRPRALQAYSVLADDSGLALAEMNILLRRSTRLDIYNIADETGLIFSSRYECPTRDKLLKALRDLPPRVPILRQPIVSDEAWLKSRMYEIGMNHGIYIQKGRLQSQENS